MTTHTKFLSLGVIGLTTAYSQAAIIWGDAQNIVTEIDDVSTNGSLHAAVNAASIDLVDGEGVPNPDITLNGVVFESGNINDATNISTTSFNSNNDADLNVGGIGDTTAYQTFLGDIDFAGNADPNPGVIDIENLVVGNLYEIQVWYVDNRPGGNNNRVTTFSSDGDGGNSVALNDQFAIGTFTADALTESFSVSTSGALPNLTGFQVRDLGAVPEPSSALLSGISLLALLARRRR